MRKALAGLIELLAVLTISPAAFSQQEAASLPECPDQGYAQPFYGVAGDNDGQQRGYEIAGPCVGQEVRDAAVAIGMGRWKPLGVKTLTTMRFKAEGRIASESGAIWQNAEVDMGVNFTTPAARLDVTRNNNGKAVSEIRVFSDKLAWNESSPGEGRKTAPKNALKKRSPLIKLTPFGAMWSVIEAEGHARVSIDRVGRTVITGASPYDGYLVSVTLDADSRPVEVSVKAEDQTYGASFSDYSDKWESPYLFVFPAHITWTMNGKSIADLSVTHFHSNPYVVFPPPLR